MRPKRMTSDSKGFTLVELLIVIGIIGIIAALAIPMFQNFIKKAKMVEGETALSEIKRLEEHYQDRKSTRLNSSHLVISYAVFCLKKKSYDAEGIVWRVKHFG